MLGRVSYIQTIKPHLRRGNFTLFLAAIVGIISLTFTLAISTPTGAEALVLATTKQPQPQTQVYFNDSPHLPTTLAASQAATFSFHITNNEAKTLTYRYFVLDHAPSGDTPISAGSVTLTNGQSADEPVHFSLSGPKQTSRMVVELSYPSKSINFTVTTV